MPKPAHYQLLTGDKLAISQTTRVKTNKKEGVGGLRFSVGGGGGVRGLVTSLTPSRLQSCYQGGGQRKRGEGESGQVTKQCP